MGQVTYTPVRLEVWRPRGLGLHGGYLPAYTRLRVTNRDGGNNYSIHLPWGFDLWPLY